MLYNQIMKKVHILQYLLCATMLCTAAHADEGWKPESVGAINGWNADVMGRHELFIRPTLFFINQRGNYNSDGGFEAFADNGKQRTTSASIFFQYGLTDRFELAGQTGMDRTRYEDDAQGSATSTQLQDSTLFLRCALATDGETAPLVTALFQLKMPTGKYQNADPAKLGTDITGTGTWDHGYGIVLTKRWKPFALHADAIMSFPLKTTVDGTSTQYAPYLTYDFAAEYFYTDRLSLMAEFNGFSQGKVKYDGDAADGTESSYLSTLAGISYAAQNYQYFGGWQQSLLGKNSTYDGGLVVAVSRTF